MTWLSTYWKCQLIGWTLYEIANFIFMWSYGFVEASFLTLSQFLLLFLLNIAIAHLIRGVILQFDILKKSFFSQIVFLLGVTIFFSALAFILEISLTVLSASKNSFFILSKASLPGLYILLFFVFVSRLIWNLIYFGHNYVRRKIREEQIKAANEKQLWKLEAHALRAQMNPHFIFNCMNSIKSLIQQKEKSKSLKYLNTFSKLIRTLLNNADKKEISLYGEIETCKLYLQLEAMRFDTKFSFFVNVDENIDLKSVQVPGLIIQPFIENAIWHGIVPKETGGRVEVYVKQVNDSIEVIIDDNGIGREASGQNKSASGLVHQSRGVNLTQSRLELENRLNETNARLETIDKKDDKGQSAGTKIVLTFSRY